MNCLKPMVLLLALAATSALSAEGGAAATKAGKPVTLKPQKIYEKCLSLSPPQKLQYNFGTDKAVDFDIHYHKGDLVYYPVREKRTTASEGLYTPPSREDYCMAWENRSPSADVQLEFSFKIIR
jgi:hypothetical protein